MAEHQQQQPKNQGLPSFVKPARPSLVMTNVSNRNLAVFCDSPVSNLSENGNIESSGASDAVGASETTTTTAAISSINKVVVDSSNNSLTYGAQCDLPPLPIPTLEETMEKLLRHLEALEVDGDPEERRETERVVKEFLSSAECENGETATEQNDKSPIDNGDDNSNSKDSTTRTRISGPQLQSLLLEYDRKGRETREIGSYVEEFWSEAYLAPDSSVVLNLNPYFLLEESPDPKLGGNQIRRAASLCFASVKMASQLRNGTLKPDIFKGQALCMDQFRALFGASRVPKVRSSDTITVHEKSNHVAVMCRNRLFYFQALWPDNGDLAVDEGDLVDILQAIWVHAHETERKETLQQTEEKEEQHRRHHSDSVWALGVLTSLDRNEWAQAREEMIQYSPTKNAESFAIVDSALFVLVLDDCVPKNKHEAAANMLHGSYKLSEWRTEKDAYTTEYQVGTCTNRWYDKLQIIVTADGGAGINFEHSAIDGHTALRFVSDIYADTVISFAKSITRLVHAHQGLIPSVITAKVRRAAVALDERGLAKLDVFPRKINFELSDSIKRKIYFAETALGDQILASDTHILEFTDYGKRFITFNKFSPDSYVQMSMMLAYYRLYGKIVCAYEPVLTKAFYHGRTEAMRPATMEAKKLCEMFCNPSSSREEKVDALRHATKAHSKLVKECAQGKGVDRHLFALKCIANKFELPVPNFFRSECWRKLNHTILSTSNCGNPSLALFGFGPVVPDGYGIGYIIKDSHLHYAICSKHRQTTRYALTLEGVLREMASLLEPISQTKVHDHIPGSRSSLKDLVTDVAYDSYVDVWGESSFRSLLEEGKPKMIRELSEKRWSAITEGAEEELGLGIHSQESCNGSTGINVDAKLSEFSDSTADTPPILSPMIVRPDDEQGDGDVATPIVANIKTGGGMHRCEKSSDNIPIRPNRRVSVRAVRSDVAETIRLDEESKMGNLT